ncbi:anti-sigma factor [Flavicella sediminum]|uniref:anti-sigma factor n=1 Tax=Flavicella sediminum TaxID=2585141 RepID=UPI00111FE7A6|nr:anti-sigma factor [Flavicella sediminum]
MIQKSLAMAFVAFSTLFISCNDNDDHDTSSNLTLAITGLNDLGADYVYEGWILVDGNPVTTGTFSVDENGTLSETDFPMDKSVLASATKFILTIEPKVGDAPEPSETKYLVGDFSGTSANVSTGIIGDFSAVAGQFILATPTDNSTNDANNENGIWWLNPTTSPAPIPTLVLPTLPAGWKYEGWVVANGTPITTGTFTNVAATDDAAPYSGSDALAAPNGADGFFPGEDFLNHAPSGVSFPLDVRGKTAVISIEPYPDNSPLPFTLKPLVGEAGQETAPTLHTMNSNVTASFPSGSVWR